MHLSSRTSPDGQEFASDAAVRCTRIRTAGECEAVQLAIAGYVVGGGCFLTEMILALGGGAPLPTGVTRGTTLLDFLRGIDPRSIAFVVGITAVVVFSVPHIARWAFDRSASKLTREHTNRQRRLRRWGFRALLGVAIVIAVVISAMGIVGPWQVAVIGGAKVCATVGGIVTALGLFGRRGVRLVCANCDYPMRTWHGASARCSECGNEWRRPWEARFGQREVRWMWVCGGVLLIFASMLLMVGFGVWGLR